MNPMLCPKIMMINNYIRATPNLLAVFAIAMLPFSTTFTQICSIASVLVAFFTKSYRAQLLQVIKTPEAISVITFLSLYYFSSLYSEAPLEDIFHLFKKMSKLLFLPLLIPLFQEKKWRNVAVFLFCGMTLFTMVYALTTRGAEPFKDTISTSLLMAYGGFIFCRQFFLEKHLAKKTTLFVCFCLFCLFSITYNVGRSGFIVFLLLCLLAFFQTGGFRRLIKGSVGLMIFVLIGYFYSTSFQQRIQDSIESFHHYDQSSISQAKLNRSSIGTRLNFLENGYEIFQNKPIFGYGAGSLKTVYANHVRGKGLSGTTNPHNEYLNVLIQLGFVGFVGLCGMFFVLFQNATSVLPLFEKHLAQGCIITILVGSFLNSWLMDFMPGYLFVLFLALSFGAREKSRNKS